jgi:hypothetical protein
MKTLIANLKHAARNWDTVAIGGGCFSPIEIIEAIDQLEALQKAARQAMEAMQWDVGGEPLPTLEVEAIAALKSALRHFEEQA